MPQTISATYDIQRREIQQTLLGITFRIARIDASHVPTAAPRAVDRLESADVKS
jgi:hypothetical protein